MLRELTIENYRCFEKLHVKDLAQVNLIVGKNNVGKTSFLEAVYLYVSQGDPKAFLEILSSRERTHEHHLNDRTAIPDNYYAIGTLFHQSVWSPQINQNGSGPAWFSIKSDLGIHVDVGISVYGGKQEFPRPQQPSFILTCQYFSESPNTASEKTITFPILQSKEIDSWGLRNPIINAQHYISPQPSQFIEANGLEFGMLHHLWDSIALTPEEDEVKEAMKILVKDLDRIGFIGSQPSLSGIKIRLNGQSTPIPLSSFGDGMRRILGIAISLSGAKSGCLIIDEIDTGLHYNAQTDMWRLVLETAKRLNVQVFATTHSWDCIAAFQAALAEMEDQSIGKLIRLDARGDQLRAIEYDAEDLEITVAQGIEVR
jgi:hypothetical protein